MKAISELNKFVNPLQGDEWLTVNKLVDGQYVSFKVSVSAIADYLGAHKVTFVTNGGSEVETQIVMDGSVATEPITTKEGYTFTGWYLDESTDDEFDFINTPVDKDMTLYAKWTEERSITITFNTDGGSSVSAQTILAGQRASIPNTPSKTVSGISIGFSGWFSDAEKTSTFDFNDRLYEDTVVYAKWTNGTDWTTLDPEDLELGDLLLAPDAYGFAPIVLRVVDKADNVSTRQNHTHTVTLQTINVLSTSGNGEFHKEYDSNHYNVTWRDQSIRTWLNNSNAPQVTRGNFAGSFLVDTNGNAKTGEALAQTEAFLNLICEAYTPTGQTSSNVVIGTYDKFWLASTNQVGSTYCANVGEGNTLQYYQVSGSTLTNRLKAIAQTTGSVGCYVLMRTAASSTDMCDMDYNGNMVHTSARAGYNTDRHNAYDNGISVFMTIGYPAK